MTMTTWIVIVWALTMILPMLSGSRCENTIEGNRCNLN